MYPLTLTQPVAVLTGPTSSGKTSIALEFARKNKKIEIINADSILVYKEFIIGSAKPSREEQEEIPHHLIDVVSPEEDFDLKFFVDEVEKAITAIEKKNHLPVIVGGTGFYLKALVYGIWDAPKTQPEFRKKVEAVSTETLYAELISLDAKLTHSISKNDRYRVIRALEILKFSDKDQKVSDLANEVRKPHPLIKVFVIDREPEDLRKRIEMRTTQMIEQGLIEETKNLFEKHPKAKALSSVGYREVVSYLKGEKPEGRKVKAGVQGLSEEISLATQQLVKRQRTWFKKQVPHELFILEKQREALISSLSNFYSPS